MMDDDLSCDEDLIRRLPLPLAQLYRRGHNAKSPLERHQAGYYLWEASLKLLGSVAIVEFAELATADAAMTDRLKSLARPSTGHWWEYVRSLTPALADAGDTHFAAIRELLLGRSRDDLPRAAGLDAALSEVFDGRQTARATVRVSELFDRLVQYRNRVLGHGAAGQHGQEFYERLGRSLLSAMSEILNRLDPLAGRKLVYVSELRGQPHGGWVADQFDLHGETARRIRWLELPATEAARLPRPQRIYLVEPVTSDRSALGRPLSPGEDQPELLADDTSATLRQLHPLIFYDTETGEPFYFNARRGADRCEYHCYTSGRLLDQREISTSDNR